jgi:hypothetical protein
MVVLPFVTKELRRFAFAHSAGVLHVFKLEWGNGRFGTVLKCGWRSDGGRFGQRSDARCEGVLAAMAASSCV